MRGSSAFILNVNVIRDQSLVIAWSDGKTEDLINVLPEYLYMELNAYLKELQDLRAEHDAGLRDEPYHFETGEKR